jgi:hypothetical protein
MGQGKHRPKHAATRSSSAPRNAVVAAVALSLVGGLTAWILAGRSAPARASTNRPPPPGPGAAGATTRPSTPPQTAATFNGPAGVQAQWVIAENARPGTTSWQITPGSGTIAGFADQVAATAGQAVTLYVSTDAPTFHVEAYRMGYYGGMGAREVWASGAVTGQSQPTCPVAYRTNMVSCDNWSPSLRMTVTAAFVQGDYLLKLVGSTGQQSYIPLTVWDPASHATYLVENDVYTWQAWNPYGGYDFYTGLGSCPQGIYPPCNRARVVSFDRPYGYAQGAGDFIGNEYPFVSFAEERGLDVTYAPSTEIDLHPGLLLQHRALLSLGHDECWSLGERLAAQAAQEHGVNFVFFGASPILRHVRLEPSVLGAAREEAGYRDSAEDPLDGSSTPLQVTGNTWADPPASWSEVPFVGEAYSGYVEPGDPAVPMAVADTSLWLFRGTGLQDGSTLPGVLFSDFDQFDRGAHPQNLQILAHSPMPAAEIQTSMPPAYSDVSYYTDPVSGSGVFDSGTCAWIPDLSTQPAFRQMTANLLALFGTGPAGRVQPSVANWQQYYGY